MEEDIFEHIDFFDVTEENGQTIFQVQYDEVFGKYLRNLMGWKRITRQRMEKFINNALRESLKDEKESPASD